MEFISRQTKTIQSLWRNIEKVGSEIQHIQETICAWAEQIDDIT